MTYIFLLYGDETNASADPEAMEAYMVPWFEYDQMLKDKGHYVGGEALQPTATATTVTALSGTPVWTDGPFAETREQLGGFYIVRCKDLDEAMELAARCPGAREGRVEVRPILDLS